MTGPDITFFPPPKGEVFEEPIEVVGYRGLRLWKAHAEPEDWFKVEDDFGVNQVVFWHALQGDKTMLNQQLEDFEVVVNVLLERAEKGKLFYWKGFDPLDFVAGQQFPDDFHPPVEDGLLEVRLHLFHSCVLANLLLPELPCPDDFGGEWVGLGVSPNTIVVQKEEYMFLGIS
jgi:hypothetical protein